jgi:4-carboxymuconolactone decarboxylase
MSANSDFGTWGRYKEIPLDKMTPEQKRVYQLTMKERGQVPGPYKIWLQNPKLMEVMVPLGAYYQGHSSLSKAEIEIATNLTNGRWLAAYSNYEHEIIGEREGGLPPLKVQALIAGLPPPSRTLGSKWSMRLPQRCSPRASYPPGSIAAQCNS